MSFSAEFAPGLAKCWQFRPELVWTEFRCQNQWPRVSGAGSRAPARARRIFARARARALLLPPPARPLAQAPRRHVGAVVVGGCSREVEGRRCQPRKRVPGGSSSGNMAVMKPCGLNHKARNTVAWPSRRGRKCPTILAEGRVPYGCQSGDGLDANVLSTFVAGSTGHRSSYIGLRPLGAINALACARPPG